MQRAITAFALSSALVLSACGSAADPDAERGTQTTTSPAGGTPTATESGATIVTPLEVAPSDATKSGATARSANNVSNNSNIAATNTTLEVASTLTAVATTAIATPTSTSTTIRTTVGVSTTTTSMAPSPPPPPPPKEPSISEVEVAELERTLDEIDQLLADLEADLSQD